MKVLGQGYKGKPWCYDYFFVIMHLVLRTDIDQKLFFNSKNIERCRNY